MSIYGKPCSETDLDGCTLHNLHCGYPNCAKGKSEKKAKDKVNPLTIDKIKPGFIYKNHIVGHYSPLDYWIVTDMLTGKAYLELDENGVLKELESI